MRGLSIASSTNSLTTHAEMWLLLLLVTLSQVFAAGGATDLLPPTTVVPISTPPLVILGASPAQGIFDPSLVSTGNATFPLLMSFSSVGSTNNISTDLAVFTNNNIWVWVSRVNAAQLNVTLPCAGGQCVGSLISEVSSIIIDAADPDPLRRIKVFSHMYIVTNTNELHYDEGYIALSTAPAPEGPWEHEALLGWAGASPLSTSAHQILTDFPSLSDCVIFTEPGALVDKDGSGILLALGCASLPTTPGGAARIRVVLLASSDHGASWTLRTPSLVDSSDAARLGYLIPSINAANLLVAPDGGTLIIVSPSAEIVPNFSGYVGCLVLRIDPHNASDVVRDAAGVPVVERKIIPSSIAFAGACTAISDSSFASGGYLLPTLLGDIFAILPSFQPVII